MPQNLIKLINVIHKNKNNTQNLVHTKSNGNYEKKDFIRRIFHSPELFFSTAKYECC